MPVTTLDNIAKSLSIDKIDLLKLDVEGAELMVLKKAKETLSITKRIVMEVHDNVSVEEVIKELNNEVVDGIFKTKRWGDTLVYARNENLIN